MHKDVNYKNMPFIQFPSEWQLKFLGYNPRAVVQFCLQKADAPNVVSVVIFGNENTNPDDLVWEVAIASIGTDGNFLGIELNTEANIPLNDTACLLHFIEKAFTQEIECTNNEEW